MAAWRRRALEAFPSLRKQICDPNTTIYWLFYTDLLPMEGRAREDKDINTLRRLYTFAEWCSRQKAQVLWNAAGVSFYEHLFDDANSDWVLAVSLLSHNAIRSHTSLWESRLQPDEMKRLRYLIAEKEKPDRGHL